MKKLIALAVAAMMVISLIPVMAITSSAIVEGDWITYRNAVGYEPPEDGEEEAYTPAPGYEYTDEGLHMISPDFTNCLPYGTIQTKDTVDIDDGVYMEVRVDNFSYGGEDGTTDNWISFSIWNSQKISQGNTSDYGEGWLSLNRGSNGNSDAGALAQSWISGAPSTWTLVSSPAIDPQLDEEGREIFTLEVTKSGEDYTIRICGIVVSTSEVSEHLKKLNPDGQFYIGISFHSGVTGGVAEATVLKFGTSKDTAETPFGQDSAEPEKNPIVIADLEDSASVPEGQPCMIFDATRSTWSGKINGSGVSGVSLDALGNNAFQVNVTDPLATGYFCWNIRRTVSYKAEDFPVIAFLVEDPNCLVNGGDLRYCAGQYMTADDVRKANFAIFDDFNRAYGDDQVWTLFVIDLKDYLTEEELADGWTNRINSLRFDFVEMSIYNDAEMDWFNFHWAGVFRSVEDAYAYGDTYMAAIDPTLTPSTSAPETTDPVDVPDVTDNQTNLPEETTAEPQGGEETTNEDKGCSSSVGSIIALMAAAAAAVALKKKD